MGGHPESRKIQKVGAATLTISLPKDWVDRMNLKKGDQVFISEDGEALCVVPGPAMEERRRTTEKYLIDADLCVEPGILERVIVGNYVLGRQEIIVRSASRLRSEYVEEVRRASKMLMGLGIIEETANAIRLHCSVDPANYPMDDVIKRLYRLGVTMLQEAIEALVTGDRRLAEDAIKREDDADTMYWLILRLVLSAQVDEARARLLGIRSRLEVISYRLINRDLEAVADYGEIIARAVLALLDRKIDLNPSLAKRLKELSEAVTAIYAEAIGGLLSRDIKQANAAICRQDAIVKREDDLLRMVLKDYDDAETLIDFRTILDGVMEVFEYGHSIAVVAINCYLERPTKLSRPALPA